MNVVTGLATSWDPNPSGGGPTVATLSVNGPTVYVGGDFLSIGGKTRSYLAALDASSGLATDWSPGANSAVLAMAVSGSTVYVGGDFSDIGGEIRNYIAALDASTGLATSWNPDPNAIVYVIAVSGSTVYVGGYFVTIGGQTRNYLAALDVTSGLATAWNPNPNAFVDALTVSGLHALRGRNLRQHRWDPQLLHLRHQPSHHRRHPFGDWASQSLPKPAQPHTRALRHTFHSSQPGVHEPSGVRSRRTQSSHTPGPRAGHRRHARSGPRLARVACGDLPISPLGRSPVHDQEDGRREVTVPQQIVALTCAETQGSFHRATHRTITTRFVNRSPAASYCTK